MITQYCTIARQAEAEIEVSRSRFLAIVAPAADESEAREVIATARQNHRSARHHCTAFILGADGGITRTNDDGEPSGTAGQPMLTALQGEGVTFLVAVVVRWFGGVKLGTGGLSRAYGHAASQAMACATRSTFGRRELYSAQVGFADAARVENAMRSRGHHVHEVTYGETNATVTFAISQGERELLSADLDAAVCGRAELIPGTSIWQPLS